MIFITENPVKKRNFNNSEIKYKKISYYKKIHGNNGVDSIKENSKKIILILFLEIQEMLTIC